MVSWKANIFATNQNTSWRMAKITRTSLLQFFATCYFQKGGHKNPICHIVFVVVTSLLTDTENFFCHWFFLVSKWYCKPLFLFLLEWKLISSTQLHRTWQECLILIVKVQYWLEKLWMKSKIQEKFIILIYCKMKCSANPKDSHVCTFQSNILRFRGRKCPSGELGKDFPIFLRALLQFWRRSPFFALLFLPFLGDIFW